MEKTLTAFSLPAPAKINHFLHIIGRKEDGYHLLQTLFQFLDYGDQLHFELRQDNQIVINPTNMLGIPDNQNLIYRAAKALALTTQTEKGVTISIEKQLPLGAGLGGGSSNAATTLFALNALWGLKWSCQQLRQLGVTLGADIPIFLFGHAAWGEGIGEQLTAIELEEPWILVIVPPCHTSTPKMYADPDLTRNTPPFRIGALAQAERKNAFSGLRNDFEPLARRHYPDVDEAMKWLSNYGKAQLSGSGASVFACFDSKIQAEEIARTIPTRFKGFIAKGVNISPLRIAAARLGLTI